MRLDKFIATYTELTRKLARQVIRKGKVKVDGEIIKAFDTKIDPNTNKIEYQDQHIKYIDNYYYLLNKPKGYVSAVTDKTHKCVGDIFSDKKDLIIVGRLDIDTTGALLITNDGQFAHNVINGKKDVNKTYIVDLKDSITQQDIDKLSQPIQLKDFTTKPAIVKKISDKQIEMVITEGKYHQVKRMVLAIGNEVVNLHRLNVDNYSVKDINIGEYKEIDVL